ncbi:interleukin-23 receptor isoform X2 [Ornithorhynchus anatinus]|uniref:Interleukin 23 receptor n=1 Tax=Ornithorhynchus anatinus TaxID=9258 RepID=F7C043_ORNAN|nr:interleukin-23 receptor isoform X2 [Ornithorhynchus anatinus]
MKWSWLFIYSWGVVMEAAIKNCQPRRFQFYKNSQLVRDRHRVTRINGTTVRLRYSSFREASASVLCTALCPGEPEETLVCGDDISAGYPPDAPANLTCFIREYSSYMVCTWNCGKSTYLETKYTVHVKSLQTAEEQWYNPSEFLNISTNQLSGGPLYFIWVRAANALGVKTSAPQQVHLDEIVIPAAPIIINVENGNASVPKTFIYWKRQTSMDNVYCETRYKATTGQTWNVEDLDARFPNGQRIGYDLEPKTKYEFQARCWRSVSQPAGDGSQGWSEPFFLTTPRTGLGSSLTSSTQSPLHIEPLIASVFKEDPTFDRSHNNRGVLAGMILCAILPSTGLLVLILKKSLRIRMKRGLWSLLPSWLQEDVPNIKNSNAMKTLKEKSEFTTKDLSQQFLYSDPEITEVQETFPQEKFKLTGYGEEIGTTSPEKRWDLENPPSVEPAIPNLSDLPDPSLGYKPQTSNFLLGETPRGYTKNMDSSIVDLQLDPLGLGKNVTIKGYPRPMSPISDSLFGSRTIFLEDLSLVFDGSGLGPAGLRDLEEGQVSENRQSGKNLPDQTLVQDQLLSCLGTPKEDPLDIHSYIPQTAGRWIQ